MIKIALLGSTGSIGRQTLDVVRRYSDKLSVISLSAGTNSCAFFNQIEEFKPKIATLNQSIPENVVDKYKDTRFFSGEDAYLEAVIEEADLIVVALVGFVGVKAVLKAIDMGKDIALANKESLVVGGSLVMKKAKEKGINIYPIDSEHSAIWQSLGMDATTNFDEIYITASGGALRDTDLQKLSGVKAEEALKHPNWAMGKKITIDCATMVNKAFEVIEAKWLFNASFDKIKVLLHRESIIHSMVKFSDGAVIAQLGAPSMEVPIQLALLRERKPTVTPAVDFIKLGKMTFSEVDEKRYPCFFLAIKCAKIGHNYPCALNAANEVAVQAFLNDEITFGDIFAVLEKTVNSLSVREIDSLEALELEDKKARQTAQKIIGEINGTITC